MKLTKLIGLLTVCTTLFAFAACSDSDDDGDEAQVLSQQELVVTKTPSDRYQFILNGFSVPKDAELLVAVIPPKGQLSGEIILRNSEDPFTKYETTFTAVEEDENHEWYWMKAKSTEASDGLMFTFNGTFEAVPGEVHISGIKINGEFVDLSTVTSPEGLNHVEIKLIQYYTIWYENELQSQMESDDLAELIKGASLIENTDYTINEDEKKVILTAAGFEKAIAFMSENDVNGGNAEGGEVIEIIGGYAGKQDTDYSLWYNGNFLAYLEKTSFENFKIAFALETPAEYTIDETENKVLLTESGYGKLPYSAQ